MRALVRWVYLSRRRLADWLAGVEFEADVAFAERLHAAGVKHVSLTEDEVGFRNHEFLTRRGWSHEDRVYCPPERREKAPPAGNYSGGRG